MRRGGTVAAIDTPTSAFAIACAASDPSPITRIDAEGRPERLAWTLPRDSHRWASGRFMWPAGKIADVVTGAARVPTLRSDGTVSLDRHVIGRNETDLWLADPWLPRYGIQLLRANVLVARTRGSSHAEVLDLARGASLGFVRGTQPHPVNGYFGSVADRRASHSSRSSP